jgi:redox-sensitive bicupin YhaK (pirin superfamily)
VLTIRPAAERGASRFDWLDSRHTFSFAGYRDPQHMGFRALRVINEDRVRPGRGFGTHHHDDMEIVTYVLSGALAHRDSLGNGSTIRPGEVQRMSAGTGIEHSEFNHSPDSDVHFLQIWILPERRGLPPSYEQRAFPLDERVGELVLVASPDGRAGSVTVHQDVTLWAGRLRAGGRYTLELAPGRHGWIQVARGVVELDGAKLSAGDSLGASDERRLAMRALEDTEVLAFDLA